MFDGLHIINERKLITNVFNEFVLGITYFTTDPTGTIYDDPIYHRNDSCPPKNMQNLVCDASGIGGTHDDVKKRMYTCYIERLIYDELWQQINVMQQNTGHLDWLEDIKKAFRTCFPNTVITVFVRVIDRIPDNISVTIEDDSGTTTELFEKDYSRTTRSYNTIISCTKSINQQPVATKTNTCAQEDTWHSIAPYMPGGGHCKRSKPKVSAVIDAIMESRTKHIHLIKYNKNK